MRNITVPDSRVIGLLFSDIGTRRTVRAGIQLPNQRNHAKRILCDESKTTYTSTSILFPSTEYCIELRCPSLWDVSPRHQHFGPALGSNTTIVRIAIAPPAVTHIAAHNDFTTQTPTMTAATCAVPHYARFHAVLALLLGTRMLVVAGAATLAIAAILSHALRRCKPNDLREIHSNTLYDVCGPPSTSATAGNVKLPSVPQQRTDVSSVKTSSAPPNVCTVNVTSSPVINVRVVTLPATTLQAHRIDGESDAALPRDGTTASSDIPTGTRVGDRAIGKLVANRLRAFAVRAQSSEMQPRLLPALSSSAVTTVDCDPQPGAATVTLPTIVATAALSDASADEVHAPLSPVAASRGIDYVHNNFGIIVPSALATRVGINVSRVAPDGILSWSITGNPLFQNPHVGHPIVMESSTTHKVHGNNSTTCRGSNNECDTSGNDDDNESQEHAWTGFGFDRIASSDWRAVTKPRTVITYTSLRIRHIARRTAVPVPLAVWKEPLTTTSVPGEHVHRNPSQAWYTFYSRPRVRAWELAVPPSRPHALKPLPPLSLPALSTATADARGIDSQLNSCARSRGCVDNGSKSEALRSLHSLEHFTIETVSVTGNSDCVTDSTVGNVQCAEVSSIQVTEEVPSYAKISALQSCTSEHVTNAAARGLSSTADSIRLDDIAVKLTEPTTPQVCATSSRCKHPVLANIGMQIAPMLRMHTDTAERRRLSAAALDVHMENQGTHSSTPSIMSGDNDTPYSRMLRMGVPLQAVKHKMREHGLTAEHIDAFGQAAEARATVQEIAASVTATVVQQPTTQSQKPPITANKARPLLPSRVDIPTASRLQSLFDAYMRGTANSAQRGTDKTLFLAAPQGHQQDKRGGSRTMKRSLLDGKSGQRIGVALSRHFKHIPGNVVARSLQTLDIRRVDDVR